MSGKTSNMLSLSVTINLPCNIFPTNLNTNRHISMIYYASRKSYPLPIPTPLKQINVLCLVKWTNDPERLSLKQSSKNKNINRALGTTSHVPRLQTAKSIGKLPSTDNITFTKWNICLLKVREWENIS